jgi:hypothetical protein
MSLGNKSQPHASPRGQQALSVNRPGVAPTNRGTAYAPISLGAAATPSSVASLNGRTAVYVFGKQIHLDYGSSDVQRTLQAAVAAGVKPVCACRGRSLPALDLSIYPRNRLLRVRRRANQGSIHARGCRFFEFSEVQLSQQGLAPRVVTCDEDGLTLIRAQDLLRPSATPRQKAENTTPKSTCQAAQPPKAGLRTQFGLDDFRMLLGHIDEPLGSPAYWAEVRRCSESIHVHRVPLERYGLSELLLTPSTAHLEQNRWNWSKAHKAVDVGLRVLVAFNMSGAELTRTQSRSTVDVKQFGGIKVVLPTHAAMKALQHCYTLGTDASVVFLGVGRIARTGYGFEVDISNVTVIRVTSEIFTWEQQVCRLAVLRSNDLPSVARLTTWSAEDVRRVAHELIVAGRMRPSVLSMAGTCASPARGSTDVGVLCDEWLKRGSGTAAELATRLNWPLAKTRELAEQTIQKGRLWPGLLHQEPRSVADAPGSRHSVAR